MPALPCVSTLFRLCGSDSASALCVCPDQQGACRRGLRGRRWGGLPAGPRLRPGRGLPRDRFGRGGKNGPCRRHHRCDCRRRCRCCCRGRCCRRCRCRRRRCHCARCRWCRRGPHCPPLPFVSTACAWQRQCPSGLPRRSSSRWSAEGSNFSSRRSPRTRATCCGPAASSARTAPRSVPAASLRVPAAFSVLYPRATSLRKHRWRLYSLSRTRCVRNPIEDAPSAAPARSRLRPVLTCARAPLNSRTRF